MFAEMAVGGATCALGLCWALRVIKDEGINLLHPTKGWDKKIDVILGIITVWITLVEGPMKGIVMTFLSIAFSLMIRYVPCLKLGK